MSPRVRRKRNDQPDRSDETKELTGDDASVDEADFGSAGNGADPFEADLQGTTRKSRSVEPEAEGEDINPDRIERYPELAGAGEGLVEEEAEDEEEEEREITAQPTENAEPDFSQLP